MRFLGLVCLALCWTTMTWAEGRFALVIGNGAYESAGRLSNPVNDASDMAEVLEEIGYAVSLHLDADQLTMHRALRRFRRDSRGAEHAVIFFAGHGVAPTGTSYVLPTDARISRTDDLEFEAIDVDTLTAHVAHASELGLIILDACRDAPALAQMTGSTRSLSRGLARAAPRGGTLIAYATEAGHVAEDGKGRNSPYTAALLETLREPGLELSLFFRQVSARVLAATNGAQRPATYVSSLPPVRIFLNPAPVVAPKPAPPVDPKAQLEATLWNVAAASGLREDYEHYLAAFPNGLFAPYARRQLDLLAPAIPQEPAPIAALPKVEAPSAVALPPSASLAVPVPLPDPTPVAPSTDIVTAAPRPVPESTEPKLTGRALVQAIQAELSRIGCDPRGVDGQWGRNSQRALDLYAAQVSVDPQSLSVDPQTHARLAAAKGRICPVVCKATENLVNETCIRKTCPSGQRLTSAGQCVTRTPQAPVVRQRKCFTFNGKTVCN